MADTEDAPSEDEAEPNAELLRALDAALASSEEVRHEVAALLRRHEQRRLSELLAANERALREPPETFGERARQRKAGSTGKLAPRRRRK